MPIPGAKYRVKQTSKGPVRLAFKGKKVVEAKNMKTGDTHTPDEFMNDHAAENAKEREKMMGGNQMMPSATVKSKKRKK